MTAIEYSLQVQIAATGAELHDIRKLSASDSELTRAEQEGVSDLIHCRFSAINLAAAGNLKPRWS
jgi:HD superfamily phosphodiesterase